MYEFDEDDPQYAQEAEDLVDDVLNNGEAIDEEDNGADVMNRAMQRIEEANLFKLLIEASIFAPNSARPEILKSVNNKIRQFAINELENLLGMADAEVKPAAQAVAQFSEEEAGVVRMLISSVLKRQPSATPQATVTPVQVKPELKPIQMKQPVAALDRPKAERPPEKAAAPKSNKPDAAQMKRKTVSKGFSKPNAATKRKPMPTADQMIQNGLLGMPGIQVSAEPGVSQKNVQKSSVTVGNLINQIAGGHSVHVDNSNPADAAMGGDSGGDTNERF